MKQLKDIPIKKLIIREALLSGTFTTTELLSYRYVTPPVVDVLSNVV